MAEFYGDDDDFDWTLPPEMVAAGVVTTTTSTTAFSSSSNNNKNTDSGWSGKPATTATTTTVKSTNGNNHGWPSEDGWPDDDSFDWAAKPATSNPAAKTAGPATPKNISKNDGNISFNDWVATPETAPAPKQKAKTPKKPKEKLDKLPAKTPATKNELPVEEVEKERAMAAIEQQFGPPLNQNSKPPANNASNANKEPLQAGSFRPLPDCCSPRPYLALKHEQVVVLKVLNHQAEVNDSKKNEVPKKGAISLNWRELIDLETFTPLPETKFAEVEDPVESQLYLSWYANWKRWKEGQQSKQPKQQQQQQLQMTTNVTEKEISFSANIRTTPIPSISPIQRATSSSPLSSPFVHRAAFTATVSYENDQQAATTTTTTTCVQAQSSQQFHIGGVSKPTKIKDTKEEDAQKVRSLTSRVNCGGGNLLEALEDQEEAGDPTPVLVPLKVSSRVVVIGGTPPRMTTTTTTANWTSSTSPSSSLHHQSQVRLVS